MFCLFVNGISQVQVIEHYGLFTRPTGTCRLNIATRENELAVRKTAILPKQVPETLTDTLILVTMFCSNQGSNDKIQDQACTRQCNKRILKQCVATWL